MVFGDTRFKMSKDKSLRLSCIPTIYRPCVGQRATKTNRSMRTHYLKKWLAALLLPLAAVSANAQKTLVDGIYYKLNQDTKQAEVAQGSDFDYYAGEVTIPSAITYNGVTYEVTSIEKRAFQCCSGLTSVIIPESVTTIEDGTFQFCSALTSVTIPSSVMRIKNSAFFECSALTSLTIPSNIKIIEYYAFARCSALTSVIIPSNVTSLEDGAFAGCSGLTTIVIPSNVTSIGGEAFAYCSGLTSAVISSSVTSIGEAAFQRCNGLTSVTCYASEPPALEGSAWWTCAEPTPKLYVPASSVEAYKALPGWAEFFSEILPIGDGATGLSELDNQTIVESSECQIYNLSGQRITKMQKGVNIINGKKILK